MVINFIFTWIIGYHEKVKINFCFWCRKKFRYCWYCSCDFFSKL